MRRLVAVVVAASALGASGLAFAADPVELPPVTLEPRLAPAGGDPAARGNGIVKLSRGQFPSVCWEFAVTTSSPPTGFGLRRDGRTVAKFNVPSESPSGGRVSGCVGRPAALVRDILRRPQRYKVLLRTRSHPRGALAARLRPR